MGTVKLVMINNNYISHVLPWLVGILLPGKPEILSDVSKMRVTLHKI